MANQGKNGMMGRWMTEKVRITDMEIPQAVEKIIDTLEAGGFEAYAVGGCVRDTLLGREP